jgi:hypothetical protein
MLAATPLAAVEDSHGMSNCKSIVERLLVGGRKYDSELRKSGDGEVLIKVM